MVLYFNDTVGSDEGRYLYAVTKEEDTKRSMLLQKPKENPEKDNDENVTITTSIPYIRKDTFFEAIKRIVSNVFN